MKTKTLSILQELSSINDTQVIKYPRTVINMGEHISAFFDIDKHEASFNNFGIYSMSKLGNIIKQVGADSINFLDDKRLEIKNTELDRTLRFPTDNPETFIMELGTEIKPEFIDASLDPLRAEKVTSFNIKAVDLANILGLAGIMSTLEDITFVSKNNEIKIVLDEDNIAGETNYTVGLEGISKEDFTITMKINVLALLPKHNYKIDIMRSIKNPSRMRGIFTSNDVEGLRILLTAKSKI